MSLEKHGSSLENGNDSVECLRDFGKCSLVDNMTENQQRNFKWLPSDETKCPVTEPTVPTAPDRCGKGPSCPAKTQKEEFPWQFHVNSLDCFKHSFTAPHTDTRTMVFKMSN